jgi:hypothetical protein
MLTAIGDPSGGVPDPKPGQPVMCGRCGVVSTISEDGMLRPLTEAEAFALMKDKAAVKALRRLVDNVKTTAMREALFMALRRT